MEKKGMRFTILINIVGKLYTYASYGLVVAGKDSSLMLFEEQTLCRQTPIISSLQYHLWTALRLR